MDEGTEGLTLRRAVLLSHDSTFPNLRSDHQRGPPEGVAPCGGGVVETRRRRWARARRLPVVAGRIRDDDIAEVREKARIDDVVSQYVTLKRAGGGSLKGLCPFHDEKTPSFNVNSARQFFHCFGCGEGGDVIAFIMKVDGLTFTEAVERLGGEVRRPAAPRGGRRRAGPPARPRPRAADRGPQGRPGVLRRAAGSADAVVARQFLHQRGFDQSAAAMFGVGFAPRDGEALTRHLRGRRFTDEESVAAGLVAHGRSHYDRFRGRLVWPIREANGDTIGFGARRIFDDDRIEAKYLNTSETAIYKKSQVLYGIDLARTAMKDAQQAVVVEGYTDVMACHLAGVRTAVASCGTAFGTDHARVLRRFLGDHGATSGEVIFTFDGDSAGQKAAMKVLESDQVFASQTYVAVAPEGMDPCDLRIKDGDEAVRELVAKRQPLYRFALDNILARHDLDRADGRVDALRDAAGLVASIRDKTKVESFSRELAHMVGVDLDEVRNEVRRAASRPAPTTEERRPPARRGARGRPGAAPPDPAEPVGPALPHRARAAQARHPAPGRGGAHHRPRHQHRLHPPDVPGRLGGRDGGRRAGAGVDDPGWANRVRGAATEPAVVAAITELGVEPVRGTSDPNPTFAVAYVYRLQELTTSRRIADVKARLQRTNPVEHALDYNRMFGELVMLEQHRRKLREGAVGPGATA